MQESLRVLSHLVSAKVRRPTSDNSLHELQSRKLRQALDSAAKTFSFYRSLLGADLESFPTMEKATFIRHFHELNILGLPIERARQLAAENEAGGGAKVSRIGVQLGLSTGTSGQRGVFMTSAEERSRWAGTIIERCVPQLWARHKIALFLRADNQLYQSAEKNGRIHLRHFSLTARFDQSLGELNDFEPDILIAPPYILARLATDRRCTIEPGRTISVADVLDPWDEIAITGRFRGPLHQIYQATEGFLGATCLNGSLHLNEDLLLFEKRPLDSRASRFSPVITDFHRKTQAIIRFHLNDVLRTESEPCPCGSPLARIRAVEGRTDEVFLIRNGDESTPAFRGDLTTGLRDLGRPLPDFRLTQLGHEEFELRLPPDADQSDSADLAQAFSARLSELGVEKPEVTVIRDLVIPLYEKRRRFVRSFRR